MKLVSCETFNELVDRVDNIPAGQDGVDGINGTNGINGINGQDGVDGVNPSITDLNNSLQVDKETIRQENYFAKSINGTTQSNARNMTASRTAVGRWDVVLNPAHPDGVNYHPSIMAEEQSANRDTPDINIVQGSQTANGFSFEIVTGDNGAGADVYVDTPFTIGIDSPIEVVTGVSFV